MMMAKRHRSAWIWLAITAIAVASLARAQAGVQSASAYTHPVLEFLAAHQNAATLTSTDHGRNLHLRSARQATSGLGVANHPGVWQAVLPVLFIGLIAPLNQVSSRYVLCLGRTPSAPALPSRFQRPPPFLSV